MAYGLYGKVQDSNSRVTSIGYREAVSWPAGYTETALSAIPTDDPPYVLSGSTAIYSATLAASDNIVLAFPWVHCGRIELSGIVNQAGGDVTASTAVSLIGYKGEHFSVYDGTFWQRVHLDLDNGTSLNLTATQAGTTTNGNKIISGLTDTSQLVRGMKITGTNVGAASVIATIDSATQVTGTVNSTGSATNTMTFKCPASENYDVFLVPTATSAQLQLGTPWGATTRPGTSTFLLQNQNGILTNKNVMFSGDSNQIAARTGRYLGTLGINTTDGQSHDNTTSRLCWNYYNRLAHTLSCVDTTDTWNYTTATWREVRGGSTLGTSRVEFIRGYPEDDLRVRVHGIPSNSSASIQAAVGVGFDSTTVNSAQVWGSYVPGALAPGGAEANAFYSGKGGAANRQIVSQLEISTASGTTTWRGDNGNVFVQEGMLVEFYC